jgi:predicted dehydrogenase
MVRIGIIGSGYMALTYAECLARHVRGGRLVAVAGGRRASGLAEEYSVAAEPDIESLLARGDVDAVILATPDYVHCGETLQAAAAGKHVLVEKPMAPTAAQCGRMIEACRAAGVSLAVVKTERYRRVTRMAKQLIEAGRIGRVCALTTISSFPAPVGQEIYRTRPWYSDPEGGGLFLSMASHNADMLMWLAERKPVRVFAEANTFGDLAEPAQSVMATIAFEGGAMAQMWICAELPPPGLPSSEVRFQVVGSQGMLDFENYEFLRLGSGDQWETLLTPERFDYFKEPKSPVRLEPHIGVVQDFVSAILENRPPVVGGTEGRAAVELCEACLRSARAGQAVALPLGN